MKTVLNIKVDTDIKKRAQELAKAMGVPLSTIVNAQLSKFVSERQLEISAPLIPSAKTRRELDTMLREIKKGDRRNFLGPFKNTKEARRALETD